MSVTSVKLKSSKASADLQGKKEDRVYVVVCSSASDTATTARTAAGIPQIGAVHPTDSAMFCLTNGADYVEDSAYVFEVTVQYATPTPQQQQQQEADPDDDPVEFSCRGVEVTYPMHVDADGTPVINTAGDSFDPPPNGLTYDEENVVVRSQTTIDPELISSYRGAVNADEFTIIMQDGTSRTFAAKSCRMGNITYQLATRNGITYWKVSYPILWREPTDDNGYEPWRIGVLNEGYRELVGTSLVDCTVGGKRATHPVKLNSSGRMYSDQSAANFYIKYFKDYFEMPFGTLNLTN